MSHVIPQMRRATVAATLVVVSFAFVTASGQPPCDGTQVVESIKTTELPWAAALDWFLQHDETAKSCIEGLLVATSDPAVRSLCKVLLAEWKTPLGAESFLQPRLVYAPEIEVPGSETADPPSVVFLEFVVSPSGTVRHVRVARGIFSDPSFEDVLLAAYEKACFRPAIKGGEFIEAKHMMMYRLERH